MGLSGGERAFPGSSTESAFRERRPIDRGCSPPPYGPADTQPGRPPPPLVPLTRQCIRSASFKPQAIFFPAVELSELSLAPRFLRGTREPADKNQPLRSCHFPVHVSKKQKQKTIWLAICTVSSQLIVVTFVIGGGKAGLTGRQHLRFPEFQERVPLGDR